MNGSTAIVNGDQTIGSIGISVLMPATPDDAQQPATAIPLLSDPTDTIPDGKGLLLVQIGPTLFTQLQVMVE